MLSIARARQLVGPDSPLTDEQLARLCDELYPLARAAVSCYLKESAGPRPSTVVQTFTAVLESLPELEREELEERAAIMEYDGGMDRGEAERAAMRLHDGQSAGEAA